jgi:hypothetical protein
MSWNADTVLTTDFNSLVRFQVLMAASMKMAAFWDIASCCLVKVDRRFRGTYFIRAMNGSTHLLNVGLLQRHNTVLYPKGFNL